MKKLLSILLTLCVVFTACEKDEKEDHKDCDCQVHEMDAEVAGSDDSDMGLEAGAEEDQGGEDAGAEQEDLDGGQDASSDDEEGGQDEADCEDCEGEDCDC